ncbi:MULTISPECIES: RHS repeat-associated core domain-containing protein [Pseudomonas]|nr:RHS repeat-associated core domain-containing protein [Pseudomonas soli]
MATSNLLSCDHMQSPLMAQTGANRLFCVYNPYGHRAEKAGDPGTGFTGQCRESRQGWCLLGNGYRVYNPVLMRFHSPDQGKSPWGRGGINSYAYCHGDPVNFHDRSGREPGRLNSMVSSDFYSSASWFTNVAAGAMPAIAYGAMKSIQLSYGAEVSPTDMKIFGAGAAGAVIFIAGEYIYHYHDRDLGTFLKDIGTSTANISGVWGLVLQRRDAATDHYLRVAVGDQELGTDPSAQIIRRPQRSSFRVAGGFVIRRPVTITDSPDTSSNSSDSPPQTPGLLRSVMGSLNSIFSNEPRPPGNIDEL